MSKKRRPFTSAKTKAYDEIRRRWGDVDVVDAPKDLRVFIQPEDVMSATAKDPGCCVFAQACKRQFSATKVLFWRTCAYVDLPWRNGKRRVERFMLSPEMRRLIEAFDRGRDVGDVAGFELKKPKPSMTFAGKAKANLAQSRKRRALLNGVRVPQRGHRDEKSIVVDLEVRNGMGRVQFKKAEA